MEGWVDVSFLGEYDFLQEIRQNIESIIGNNIESWMRQYVGYQFTTEMQWCPNRMPHYEGDKIQKKMVNQVIDAWKQQGKSNASSEIEDSKRVWKDWFRIWPEKIDDLFDSRLILSGTSRREEELLVYRTLLELMLDFYEHFVFKITLFYQKECAKEIKMNMGGTQYQLKDVNITWCMPAMIEFSFDIPMELTDRTKIMELAEKRQVLNTALLEFYAGQLLDSRWIHKAKEKHCKYVMKFQLYDLIRLKDGTTFKNHEISISTPDDFFQNYHVKPFLESLYAGLLDLPTGLEGGQVDAITRKLVDLLSKNRYSEIAKQVFYDKLLEDAKGYYQLRGREPPVPLQPGPAQDYGQRPIAGRASAAVEAPRASLPQEQQPRYSQEHVEQVVLGMLQTVKKVSLNDASNDLGLPRQQLKVAIYSLVGAGKVKGEFTDNDTFQLVAEQDGIMDSLDKQFSAWKSKEAEKDGKLVDTIPNFMCPACKHQFHIDETESGNEPDCPTCAVKLNHVFPCPHCNEYMALPPEQYKVAAREGIACIYCNKTFTP